MTNKGHLLLSSIPSRNQRHSLGINRLIGINAGKFFTDLLPYLLATFLGT